MLRAQGRLAGALKAYRDGLAIREGLAKKDPDNAGWQGDLSIGYDRVGNVLSAQGQFDEALKAYLDDRAIMEGLVKKDPDNAEWQRDLAISDEKVGDIARLQQQWPEAARIPSATQSRSPAHGFRGRISTSRG